MKAVDKVNDSYSAKVDGYIRFSSVLEGFCAHLGRFASEAEPSPVRAIARYYLSRALLALEQFEKERERFNSFVSDVLSISEKGHPELLEEMAFYFEWRKELFNAEPFLYRIFEKKCPCISSAHVPFRWHWSL